MKIREIKIEADDQEAIIDITTYAGRNPSGNILLTLEEAEELVQRLSQETQAMRDAIEEGRQG
jgi:hypothetical protein